MTSEASRPRGEATPSDFYVLLRRPSVPGDFWASPRDMAALLFLALPLVILLATLFDGTYSIADGKGWSQHHGFWAIFITTPALVLLSGALLDRFMKVLNAPNDYLTAAITDAQLSELQTLIN